MNEHELLSVITKARAEFDVKSCKKFSGALTIQLLKKALHSMGLNHQHVMFTSNVYRSKSIF